MSAYSRDRAFTETFVADIRNIVGPRLMVPADRDRDCREATDFLVLKARDMRIAARVRRHKSLPGGASYADKYPWDFTIRWRRDNGQETEGAKIIKGFADWLFYGHAGVSGLVRWMLIDLHVWRYWWDCQRLRPDLETSRALWDTRPNVDRNGRPDGTHLAWFRVTSFSRAFGGLVVDADPLPPGKRYGSTPTLDGMDRR